MKNIRVFYLKIFNFLEMKVSIYLNWRVFVMTDVTVSKYTALLCRHTDFAYFVRHLDKYN